MNSLRPPGMSQAFRASLTSHQARRCLTSSLAPTHHRQISSRNPRALSTPECLQISAAISLTQLWAWIRQHPASFLNQTVRTAVPYSLTACLVDPFQIPVRSFFQDVILRSPYRTHRDSPVVGDSFFRSNAAKPHRHPLVDDSAEPARLSSRAETHRLNSASLRFYHQDSSQRHFSAPLDSRSPVDSRLAAHSLVERDRLQALSEPLQVLSLHSAANRPTAFLPDQFLNWSEEHPAFGDLSTVAGVPDPGPVASELLRQRSGRRSADSDHPSAPDFLTAAGYLEPEHDM